MTRTTKGLVRSFLSWIARTLGVRRPPAEKAKVFRVVEPGKPRFQLRQGEEGLSVFDAGHVKPEDILPAFRPGSLVVSRDVEWLESFGLQVVKTPDDPGLPKLLQDNHAIICAGNGMTRKQFKQMLKALEDATRV
jgi:hypothetical protein